MPGVRKPGWVLVVAADAAWRLSLFHLLEREGHRATVADDGRAALALLRAEPFDMVLLDMSSHPPDAAALLREIGADARLNGLPVLVTWSEGDSSAASHSIASWANGVRDGGRQ